MRVLQWTPRAQDDLSAIHAFIAEDSPHVAFAVVRQLLAAVERLREFPQSGRVVPEIGQPTIREVIRKPYRIVYRVVTNQELHVLTIHHGARRFPERV